MSLEACRALVEAADPDRFVVTQTAPVAAQEILWPLYAFNIEVTRAPWVTQEPGIAEIRLQWWRDALEEIREGRPVRAHEVTTPLASFLQPEDAMALDKLVAARIWDIYSDPFADLVAFETYIDDTYGSLMRVAARHLGAVDEKLITKFAFGAGVAAMLRAAPGLSARGRQPLPVEDEMAYYTLAKKGFSGLNYACRAHRSVPRTHAPLMLSGWLAHPTYVQAMRDPKVAMRAGVTFSEFSRRARLLKTSLFGWHR